MEITYGCRKADRFKDFEHKRKEHLKEYSKMENPKMQNLYNFIATFAIFVFLGFRAYAEGESITKIYTTKAFQGSWEVINKFNWLGRIINFLTSSFCFLGLALVFLSTLVTLLYLAGKNLFDNVHTVKTGSAGGKAFGLENLFRNAWNGAGDLGMGFDVFINFLLGLLPDIYNFSEYAENASGFGVSGQKLNKDTDTIFAYAIKTTPTKILLIFFLAMGWNGSLGQAYGVCVDACGVVGEKFVTSNLDGKVARALGSLGNLRFTFGAEGTEEGKLLDKIAFSIYSAVTSKADVTEQEELDAVFASVENYVGSSLRNKVAQMATKQSSIEDKRYKRITYEYKISSNNLNVPDNGIKIPFTELGFEGTDLNVYLYLQYDGDDDVNYMQPSIKEKKTQQPKQN